MTALPIDAVLPDLLARLAENRNVVLEAPPGAGKTTRAPLAIYEHAGWRGDGVVLMLEPRRVAARAAAARLAASLDEPVGQRVGYRIRHETRVSKATRIEVVTEGVLTRRLQSDPSLDGVAAVLFDEIHERSLHADLGLALCLEAQAALRPDLRLVAMSATLDGARLAALMNAAVVRAEGRAFAVETAWRATPLSKDERAPRRFERLVAAATVEAMAAHEGDALVFLPGGGEIRACAAALSDMTDDGVEIRPLYGALPFAEQQAALAPPSPGRRKVVVATNIAETSLTIPGVRIVVDAGRSRRARFDPTVGMDRLATLPVSRAAAEQRRGRAGRTAPGFCARLWSKGEEGALPAYDPPEILECDLAGLALELAAWGARPGALPFLDPPPEAAYAQAEALLRDLGALDASGRITPHGQAMARAPLHPRLAHMALSAQAARPLAARVAALIEEGDFLRDAGADVALRLDAIADPRRAGAARPAAERLATSAAALETRLAPLDAPAGARASPSLSAAALVALAYPDRVALRRAGDRAEPASRQPVRYATRGGRGVELAASDPLARAPLLAVATLRLHQDARDSGRDPRITLAAPLTAEELEALFGEAVETVDRVEWSKRDAAVLARRERRLGALSLSAEPLAEPDPAALTAAMLEGVRQLGLDALPWSAAAARLRDRVARARASGDPRAASLPDFSDDALRATLEAWLGPYLGDARRKSDLAKLDLAQILDAGLDHAARQALDALLPARFTAPGGASAPIDYAGAQPRIRLRLQALFGVTAHPMIAGQPLLIELLSPAERPIQLTADLPGFWAGSYADVRKDMRARYPKHAWPEDPAAAEPPKPRR